jgi:hypothetical protein
VDATFNMAVCETVITGATVGTFLGSTGEMTPTLVVGGSGQIGCWAKFWWDLRH